MRVMILGAGGMLGQHLVSSAPATVTLLPFTRAELDITDGRAVAVTATAERPNVIINSAAYTAVDRAETERDAAFRVNADAVGELGRIAHTIGARVIHFSTDYVFDGRATEPYTEESPTSPVNAYGASKLAGENALRQSQASFLIIRTQWLFGLHGKSFPRTMRDRALAGTPTKVVDDQTGRPTYGGDLAPLVWTLVERGVNGRLHATNGGSGTWFDVAQHIFARYHRRDLLSRCATSAYPTAAQRPRYSVLNTSRLERLVGGGLREWPQALDHFLDGASKS